MSPENSLNLLTYSRSDFLDKACHHFVTTNPDFARIQPDSTSFFGLKCNFFHRHSLGLNRFAVMRREAHVCA
jgi:hypothetical protein